MQAAGDRHVRPRVAREPESAHTRIAQRQRFDDGERLVARMVVDDDPFPLPADRRIVCDQTLVEPRQVGRFVERRREDDTSYSIVIRAEDTAVCQRRDHPVLILFGQLVVERQDDRPCLAPARCVESGCPRATILADMTASRWTFITPRRVEMPASSIRCINAR